MGRNRQCCQLLYRCWSVTAGTMHIDRWAQMSTKTKVTFSRKQETENLLAVLLGRHRLLARIFVSHQLSFQRRPWCLFRGRLFFAVVLLLYTHCRCREITTLKWVQATPARPRRNFSISTSVTTCFTYASRAANVASLSSRGIFLQWHGT